MMIIHCQFVWKHQLFIFYKQQKKQPPNILLYKYQTMATPFSEYIIFLANTPVTLTKF